MNPTFPPSHLIMGGGITTAYKCQVQLYKTVSRIQHSLPLFYARNIGTKTVLIQRKKCCPFITGGNLYFLMHITYFRMSYSYSVNYLMSFYLKTLSDKLLALKIKNIFETCKSLYSHCIFKPFFVTAKWNKLMNRCFKTSFCIHF